MASRNRRVTLLGELFYPTSQLAIAGWLVVASRLATNTPPDLSGVLDDLSLVLFFGTWQAAIAAATRKRPTLFAAASLSAVVLLAWAVFANAVFFSFFRTPLSVASIQLAGIAADASSSLSQLLSVGNVGGLLLLPIAAHLALLRTRDKDASSSGGLVLLFAALLVSSAAAATREPVLLLAQHNPTAALVRDAGGRLLGMLLPGDSPDTLGQSEVLSLLNREGYAGYRFAGTEQHPLRQQASPSPPLTEPRNVVLILMESMRGLEMQGRFRELPVTPRLNALESESVIYPNFYANGMTTVDGEFSILCSALPVVGETPVYVRKPELDIRCLPEILQERGYATHWISAYKSSYANKRIFLTGHGVKQVHDRKSFSQQRAMHPKVGWGMGDIDMFDQALRKIARFREPFFAEIMTLSNHHPFDHDYDLEFPASLDNVAGDQHYRDYLKGMYYTDHAVGGFLDGARGQPWFERTLFVIVGDHAVRAYPSAAGGGDLGPVLESEVYFRGRLQLYGPGWLPSGVDRVLGSQIDVTPTILDLLGIRADNSFIGVSLHATLPRERRFALMSVGHIWNVRVGDHYCSSVGYSCFEGVFPRCKKGEEPTSLGHTCFASDRDLLLDDALTAKTTPDKPRSLDSLERFRLMDRAARVMQLNATLIDQDRFR